MRINLISRDNGVGLSTDMALLESILAPAGHEVRRVDWRATQRPYADVGIHLELLNPSMLLSARHNIGIFNLEWFQPSWRRYLPNFRQLWAKSRECHDVFRRWGMRNVHHTGFLGRDMYDPGVPREWRAVHLAGHSSHKHTDMVIGAWQIAPDRLPPLTVISHHPRQVPRGVRMLSRIGDDELRTELNGARLHLCPSRAEGWGHYITEAMSTANLVITTDASPMNEHIWPTHGLLIKPSARGSTHAAATHGVTVRGILDAVHQAETLDGPARALMGAAARQHLLARNAAFTKTALDLLHRLR